VNMEERLVGMSAGMRHIREEILALAPSTLSILVIGETGTGKEVVARELYAASKRSAMPFLPMNCAALGTLADSELFGHVKGSFTGAMRSTSGYVGAANGGTLFLDEIEALSLDVQAKILRFLDSGEYSKVGDPTVLHADVRVISASNKSIEELCAQGKFRQDLYYRISGAVLHTTSLRSRREDIPGLAAHFLHLFAASAGRAGHVLLPNVMKMLVEQDWPGNARQLKQTIHNLFARHSHQEVIGGSDSPLLGMAPALANEFPSYQDAMASSMEQARRKYFTALLALTRGKAKKAVELSKMNRKNFYAVLRTLGLPPKGFR